MQNANSLEQHECEEPLRRFIDQCDSIVSAGKGSFWRCESALATLLRSRLAIDWMNQEFAKILAEPWRKPGETADLGLMMASSARVGITLKVTPVTGAPLSEALYCTPQNMFIGVLGPRSAHVRRWQRPSCEQREDVIDRSTPLEPIGEHEFGPGEILAVRAHRDVIELVPAPRATVILRLIELDALPFGLRYNRTSLCAERLIVSSTVVSRLEYTIRLLGEIGTPESKKCLAKFLDHPNYMVRWAALRAICGLDRSDARSLLETGIADPHPSVQRSSARALRSLHAEEASHGIDASH